MNAANRNRKATATIGFRALIALLSIGWLVPMWLGVSNVLDFVALELQPLLLQQPKLNSFPFIDFAGRCFAFAFLWLAAALAGWAWFGVAAWQRASRAR
jgi:hypothetical protein